MRLAGHYDGVEAADLISGEPRSPPPPKTQIPLCEGFCVDRCLPWHHCTRHTRCPARRASRLLFPHVPVRGRTHALQVKRVCVARNALGCSQVSSYMPVRRYLIFASRQRCLLSLCACHCNAVAGAQLCAVAVAHRPVHAEGGPVLTPKPATTFGSLHASSRACAVSRNAPPPGLPRQVEAVSD